MTKSPAPLSLLAQLRQNALLRNGALVFAAQMLVNVCNFAFHFSVSRRIGVVAYGTLNALVSGYQVLLVPALIVTTVLVKYAAEFHAAGEYGRLRALLSRSMLVLSLAAAGLFAVGALCSGGISVYLNGAARLPILLMLGILCLNLLLPIRGIVQGIEHFKPYSVSLTLEAAGKVALAIAFTALGWGLAGALGGWLLGCVLALAYTWLVQWVPYRKIKSEPLDIDIRKLFATTGSVALATLFVASLGFSDVVLVKHYFDPTSAGLYGAAALSGKMLYFLVYFVPAVVLPRVASSAAEGKPTGPILLAAIGVTALMGGGGALFYFFFGGLVVKTLAGAAFAAAAPLVFPYGIASTLLAALNVAMIYKVGLGRFGFVAPLGLVAVLQLIAISLFHKTAAEVIDVLTCCNIGGLIVVMLPFGKVQASRRQPEIPLSAFAEESPA